MPTKNLYCIFFAVLCLAGCRQDDSHLFTKLSENSTGIDFKNVLVESETANVLNYAYFYNGGGVAIGDINNDGLPDILFTGNMVSNRLYLNKGNFGFEDITEKSGIAKMQGWCTGATMADINGDSKLDIYICRSADIDPKRRKNLLFINNGDLTFSEEAGKYGLDNEGYSTQAAFFDYDKDGDLDMFLINHSLQEYANGAFENTFLRQQRKPEFATKLYQNVRGHFEDVSDRAGIILNVLSFGLGLGASDVNKDGWPDIYVSNDFNEPDYFFINNGDGTFSEKLNQAMDEVSLYSMGSDFADINNDGLPDLMTLDMLPESNKEQKMHSGAENFDKFQLLSARGFYYQYSRNMLQKNNGDGTFSEIGQLAGVSNTDWSWAALFCDFDNDGFKDLFVTNGYARDFTNMDFIKYQMSRQIRARSGDVNGTVKETLAKMSSVSIPNYIYKNKGNSSFQNKINDWGFNENNISSGAAYADLDGDGAMDLVINNINSPASVYRNNAAVQQKTNNYLKVKLQGNPGNTSGIGARVSVYCKNNLYFQEQFPVRGFQSSVDYILNFGLGKHQVADSVIVIWPDNRMQKLLSVKSRQLLTLNWQEASQLWRPDTIKPLPYLQAVKAPVFKHRENIYNDFTVQALMPNYLSRQGPCIEKADVNGDGREDLYIGGAKGQAGSIFTQTSGGDFKSLNEPQLGTDSLSETCAATFFDANGDGKPDLYTAGGGYEFTENDPLFQDHLYMNDGKGNFTNSQHALPELLFSKSCVKVADINGDGAMDLFIGGRVVPGKYPLSPGSRLLLNDGKGHFKDETNAVCPDLLKLGMVTDALWIDDNGGHQKDLVIVGEWMPVKVYLNQNGKLKDASAQYIKFPSTGLWNRITAADLDGDGDQDLILGNIGLNTQFKASAREPLTLYYKDFDDNGILDVIMCYYINGVSYPAPSRDDLVDQLPLLKKKYIEYQPYADAKITDIFKPDELKGAGLLKAEVMETVWLENQDSKGFKLRKLPVEAQYAPVYAITAEDVNHDGKPDLILAGNNSWTRIKFGRYKANHGMLLINDGHGNFTYVPQNRSGLNLREDIRNVKSVQTANGRKLIFGANDAPVRAYVIRQNNH